MVALRYVQLIGSADAQINVTFDSTGAATLHALMTVEERKLYKVRPMDGST